ncbi:MAG: Rpn family recombination-promoting nuclease/putative transposase [Lachnospiraceae bacterium]|nr:Rpn family recombination-promoting nuclease/putative transposase [Lachnospiraceae bacterium]
MGKKDVQTIDYLKAKHRFADMFNAVLFQGNQIVKPEQLEDVDKEINAPWIQDGTRVIRDNIQKWHQDTLYTILVIENQEMIDYHMVIRVMLAEALEYHRQWKELSKRHKQDKDLIGGHEFISGMKKEDRFTPVVTLVVYLGEDKWDASRDLWGMLQMNEKMKHLVNNYQLKIFDYHDIDDFSNFHSELKQLFQFMRYSSNEHDLKKLIAEHSEEYYNVDIDTIHMITTLTNASDIVEQFFIDEGKADRDMCKGLEEWAATERAEGRAEILEKVNELNIILVETGRLDDLVKAAKDSAFQNQLFEEFGLSKA